MIENDPVPTHSELSDVKKRALERLIRGDRDNELRSPGIPRRSCEGPVPLSYAQEQVWLQAQMAGEVPSYGDPITIRRHGALDVRVLTRCLQEIAQRHEIWRTTFDIIKGQPVQIVHPVSEPIHIPEYDLRHLLAAEMEAEARRLAGEDACRTFDIRNGPLLRAILLRVEDEEYRICMTLHHLVSDGVSAYHALLPELASLYDAFSNRRGSPLPDLTIQYADFSCWQRQSMSSSAGIEAVAYWRNQLAGELPVLPWPNDRPRPPVQSHRGALDHFEFPGSLTAKLKSFCRQEGVSVYVTLLAAFVSVLYRYTQQTEMVLGAVSSGRRIPGTETLAGYFMNPLALRVDLSGNPSFRALVARLREVVINAISHDATPFHEVVKAVRPKLDLSRNPLFQIVFSQQPETPRAYPGWDLRTEEVGNGRSKLDLIVVVDSREDKIFGPITYNPDLFDALTISQMIGHWETLLAQAVHEPEKSISELALLTEEERQRIVHDWNATHVDYPRRDQCLHQLIEAQVERSPEAIAVVFEDRKLSYRELDARANALAHRLRRMGVGPEDLVGLYMQRSEDMVIALLGILKAGGAYVPLDTDCPVKRLLNMIEDCSPKVILTQQALFAQLASSTAEVMCLDADRAWLAEEPQTNPQVVTSPPNLCYAIYTSGSTGRPKGVLNTHLGVVNRLLWMQDAYQLSPSDRVLQKTPYTFDVSVWEFLWPLMTGACMVLARPDGHKDFAYLVDLIQRERITTLHFVPTVLGAFLQSDGVERCVSLKRVICSGEALTLDLQQRFFLRCKAELHNLYGPTEAAVDVTAWRCSPDEQSATVPIGRPIANVRIYILDRNMQPVPAGVPGELHIGGIALARGYLNRPELTAEKFVPDPFAGEPGGRLYKTGDLARFRADGNIEFIGRIDEQVKINGVRIELGEIESVLREHQHIRDARVLVREDRPGERRLVAYIVPREEFSLPNVVGYVREHLPPNMRPQLVKLDSLPLTVSGKLDRKALPQPPARSKSDRAKGSEPESPLEKTLAQLWTDILRIDHVSPYDNFLDVGGHSLLAVQFVSRLQAELGVRITPREVAFQTLRQLAAVCGERLPQQ